MIRTLDRLGRALARPFRPAYAAILLILLLAACGPSAAPPPPTRTPAPTFTPTVAAAPVAVDPNALATAQAAQQQPAPVVDPNAAPAQPAPVTGDAGAQPAAPAEQPTVAPTAAPTNTPVPSAQVTLPDLVNVRSGPGTSYSLLGTGTAGQTFNVTGKSPAGDWWEIDYNGQRGWVLGQLVTATGTEAVAVAANIPVAPTLPPAPPPTNTPVPPPAAPPPTPVPADPSAGLPFSLGNTERCDPNPGQTYFTGVTRDANNNLINAVCIHIFFYEPRTTKCSGCDGVGDGNWGFSPFNGPAPRGTTVEIYVVECPSYLPMGGVSSGFGNLTPQSPKWVHTINDSEQCTGITFYKK